MLHINRRHALAGLAATAVSGRALAQPSTFTTNMYGGRWENTWREKGLPPFAKTIGRSVTPDIGLGARWVSNFRAAGKDNPPFSAVMLNERYTAMLRDDGFFEPLTPALVPNLADVVPLKQRGLPLDFVVPEEGMMVFDQSSSVAARGTDKAAAAKYLDYVLSPEIQLFMAKEWLIAPTNGKVKLPTELESLPLTPAAIAKAKRFDWTEVNKLSADLATAWSKAI